MIRWLHAEADAVPGEESRPAGSSISRWLNTAVGWLWSVLASTPALTIVLILLALWLIGVVSVTALRPGLPADSAAGAGGLTYVWDMLHPAASWALRLLLTALLIILVLRVAQAVMLSLAGLALAATPVTLSRDVASDGGDAGGESAAWGRVWSATGTEHTVDDKAVSGGVDRQALVFPRLGRRLASQMQTIGLAICVIGCLLGLGGALNIISPPLLPGEETPLSGMDGVTARLIVVQGGQSGAFGDAVRVSLSWIEQNRPPWATLLSSTRWSLSRGRWGRVSDVLPAVTVRVLDSSGATLSLQPVVGDRQAVSEFRDVLTNSDEQVLTVPDARIVLRILPAPGELDSGAVLVEALDGGLGTRLGSLRSDQQSSMSIDGVTVQAHLEQACVISFWRLPGLSLLLTGLVVTAAGAILSRRYPLWRIWVGITQVSQTAEWQVLLATDPSDLAATIAERLEPLCSIDR